MTLLTTENAKAWLTQMPAESLDEALYLILKDQVIPHLPIADQGDSEILGNILHGLALYAHEFYPQPLSSSKLHDAVMRRLQPDMRSAEEIK
jgi:hypothetical protein